MPPATFGLQAVIYVLLYVRHTLLLVSTVYSRRLLIYKVITRQEQDISQNR